ncbi:MAG TPA: NAD(P)H-dependent oxidoreductase [Opitutus sp.]|nr:NAD(P)H-dependent oxidoreductase [Opitutus sp.]
MNTTHPITTLLHLDASPRGGRSRSRHLGRKFAASWKAANPHAMIVTRDIGQEPPPFMSEAWVEGAFTPTDRHSPAAKEAIAISNQYVDELLAADEIVITTPIYNLSLPAALKAWIDQVVRSGRTFQVKDGVFKGLTPAKRVVVIVASGGDYRLTSPAGGSNFLEPYLRAVFSFIGITTVEFVYAHSLSAASQAEAAITNAETSLGLLAGQSAA